ncbi:hypothetical protein [Methanosalsum natronophilum]|uniref:Uncharacterized protein n=1 Tax=Methanosalsum natronophilum TaxID=768733 RepID=A0A424Z2E3_9EURY|nr:hypothetical protein [Methanosalsum natronophilum]MCS3923424.1 hypothetical protein [Methanosalsum natronophilum]RQD88367.1 MAG: hypothetical protein D5R95_02935 [Methanosalsum natronophilum]
MSNDSRDLIIERLERKLLQKNQDIEDMKSELKQSIISELPTNSKNNDVFDSRLSELELKVKNLSTNLNGVMNELLDQKSMINSLKDTISKSNIEEKKNNYIKSNESCFQSDSFDNLNQTMGKSEDISGVDTSIEKNSYNEADILDSNSSFKSKNARFIHDLDFDRETNDFHIKDEEKLNSGEYIVAESCDNSDLINNQPKEKTSTNSMNEPSEYIIADDDAKRKRKSNLDYETVENREGEDAVITTTRKRTND